MKLVAKVGVLLLALLIGGGQLMACMLPSSALTAEEQACCKEMANQCGQDQMPSSHPCCKKIAPSDQTPLTKSTFNLIFQAQLFYLASSVIQLAEPAEHISDTSVLLGHSPPETPFSSLDILRI